MRTIAIFVATTGGPAQIERLTPEYAPQSMVCLRRGSDILPISDDYDDFVKRGSGVIEREFGPFDYASFRMDVSANIGTGKSWQLAVFAAHAVSNSKSTTLADLSSSPDAVILLSGEVDYDLGVGAVDHISEKAAASAAFFETWVKLGVPVQVLVPAQQNFGEMKGIGVPSGVKLIGVNSASEITDLLELTDAAIFPGSISNKRSRFSWLISGIVLLAVLGAFTYNPQRFTQFFDKLNPPPEKPVVENNNPKQKMDTIAQKSAEAVKIAASKPTQIRPVYELSVLEQRPPDNETCAKVHFNRVEASLTEVPKSSARELSDSSVAGLCGLAFRFKLGAQPQFVAADLNVENGAFVGGNEKPATLSGATKISGQIIWSKSIPRRMAKSLQYRLIAIIGAKPTLPDMRWLKQQSDWKAAVDTLAKKGVSVLVWRHKVSL